MIRSMANTASPNRMIEPNLSGSSHAPTKLTDKAERARAMTKRLAALTKKNLARRRRSCWSVCRRLAMVGVVIRSSWKCDCRRTAVGPTTDPEVILSCCQSSRCHLETHAGRFKSCREQQPNCASNLTPDRFNYPTNQTGEQGLRASPSTPGGTPFANWRY